MSNAKPILGEDTIFGRLYYQDADYATLRAELAELRDRLDVMTQCADNYSRMFEESAEERDKLAGLLRDERNWSCVDISCQRGVKDHCLCGTCRILRNDAALAEVNK